ncbi:MAG: tRNA (adenosine(37)-N6)-threonylcarbamoyltransferase complex transferase subunit TsaD, partial [Candidatus Binatia bacterium]
LGFPGGRVIDGLAREGDPRAIGFPRACVRGRPYDFSFSGLKTALREYLGGSRRHVRPDGRARGEAELSHAELRDVAASFQEAVVDMLVGPTLAAAEELRVSRIVVSGGVSANSRLRARMSAEGAARGVEVFVPSVRFCTDNAAMIAFAAARKLERGERSPLDVNAAASLPL